MVPELRRVLTDGCRVSGRGSDSVLSSLARAGSLGAFLHGQYGLCLVPDHDRFRDNGDFPEGASNPGPDPNTQCGYSSRAVVGDEPAHEEESLSLPSCYLRNVRAARTFVPPDFPRSAGILVWVPKGDLWIQLCGGAHFSRLTLVRASRISFRLGAITSPSHIGRSRFGFFPAHLGRGAHNIPIVGNPL